MLRQKLTRKHLVTVLSACCPVYDLIVWGPTKGTKDKEWESVANDPFSDGSEDLEKSAEEVQPSTWCC
jgi:hypothetical protein